MDGDQADVAQRFMDDLRRLRQLAGRPSFSALERLSGHHLSRSTMSDVLNGKRVNLPDWRFVHEYVKACRAAVEEDRLDPNELGTVADWKRHWGGASSGVIDARFPGHAGQLYGLQDQALVPRQAAATPADRAERPADDLEAAAARPSVWGPVPPRLPDFVGRRAWMQAVHEQLQRGDRVGVVAIQGQFGVGKTQLAVEYAYRHADEYDLVWWVPCDNDEVAQAAMADLAAAVGVGVAEADRGSGGTSFAELFDVLRLRERFERWLLIFDNVKEPEDIRALMPPLPGDVLVTTPSSHWGTKGELLELDVFDRAESIDFLRGRMRWFAAGAAHRLAEGVGDLPLLLAHAVESRVPVTAYLARLDSEPLGLLDDQPADYHATVASVWRTAVDQLRADAPDAFDLLRCLAFFGTDGVPRESLERGSYLTDVSIHAMLQPIRLAGAIRKLRRASLLRVRPDGRSLALHRITRCLVRDLASRPGQTDVELVRHDVHLLLAAADPLTPDDPAMWRRYEELRGHAAASGIVDCAHELVRQFVVNLVRYLTAAADPAAAVSLADRALACWEPAAKGDSLGPATDCRLAMHMARADALFAMGMRSAAVQLRRDVLAVLRADPGSWGAETIALDGKSGAWFRHAGNFAQALAADQESVRAHAAEFGDDDPRTLNAADGLIADLALNGAVAAATVAARDVYRNCLAFYSDAGHPAVLAARNALGRCQWLSGEYDEAARIMAEVHGGYDKLAASTMLDESHPWRLGHEIDYAIARRDQGLMPADLRELADQMHAVRRRCWRALGPDHPQTLAATVVLGSILQRIGGRASEAVRLLGEAERRYQSALPGHPYGHACRAFLAVVRYHAVKGAGQGAADPSVPVIMDTIGHLADELGDAHPLSLTAVSALANALARTGELDAAGKHAQEALAGFRDLLGPGHPHTRAVEANIQGIQSMARRGPASAATPLVDIDFTPLPL